MRPSRPQSSEALVRKGHLTGLKPVVMVTFQSPVNFNRWKLEHLQIQMEAAPFRSKSEPKGHLERSQAWQEHEGLLGTSEGVWELLGALSGVCDLEEGVGRPQQVPWLRWGYPEAPVGSMALRRTWGAAERSQWSVAQEGVWGPQQPQCLLPTRREVPRRGGVCHELVHAHASQERQRGHTRGCQQQQPGALHPR